MFIQIEDTPNPQTLKFIPGVEVLKNGRTATFHAQDVSHLSPLAAHLLQVPGVFSVFFSSDFISITKSEDASWDSLKTLVMASVVDHFTAGYPVVLDKFYEQQSEISDDLADSIVHQIKEIIESKVRPAVAGDGGDIVFHRFENGIVYLEMHGACSGCPSSTVTLKVGIERMLKHYVPEVIAVEAV